jgi:hypothetical protein
VGVIGLAALWGVWFAIKSDNEQYYTLRNLLALYYGTILCVSNSPFTIKTAGLTWFLLGAVAAMKPRNPPAAMSPSSRAWPKAQHPSSPRMAAVR